MFFDFRLWALTKGTRAAIAQAVTIGVIASLAGIARLGLLGWLLSKVFNGSTFSDLLGPTLLVGIVMIVRGILEPVSYTHLTLPTKRIV